jgi:hypothetical protein
MLVAYILCVQIKHQHVAAYQIFAHPEHDYHTNSYIKLRQSGEAVGYISEKVITPGLIYCVYRSKGKFTKHLVVFFCEAYLFFILIIQIRLIFLPKKSLKHLCQIKPRLAWVVLE